MNNSQLHTTPPAMNNGVSIGRPNWLAVTQPFIQQYFLSTICTMQQPLYKFDWSLQDSNLVGVYTAEHNTSAVPMWPLRVGVELRITLELCNSIGDPIVCTRIEHQTNERFQWKQKNILGIDKHRNHCIGLNNYQKIFIVPIKINIEYFVFIDTHRKHFLSEKIANIS